jgi:hypothetical protein
MFPMKKLCCYSALSLTVLLSGCIVAPPRQQVVIPQQVQPGPPQQVQAVTPLGIDDVKALAKAGLSDDLIISQIRSSTTVYHLCTPDIILLKTAGVSEKVINYMINTPGTATQQPTAQVQQSVQVPQTVVVDPVVYPYYPYAYWDYPYPYGGWGWYGGRYYGGGYGHYRR